MSSPYVVIRSTERVYKGGYKTERKVCVTQRLQLLKAGSTFKSWHRRPKSSKRLWPKATAEQQQQHHGLPASCLPAGLSQCSPVPLTSKHTSSSSSRLLSGVSSGQEVLSATDQDGAESAGWSTMKISITHLTCEGQKQKRKKKSSLLTS